VPAPPRNRFERFHAQALAPAVLLLAALASLFVLRGHGSSFGPGNQGFLSSHGMTLAANLSPRHGFLMFNRMSLGKDGAVSYDAYNSFPPGAFALIKLVTLPVGELGVQISVARRLMIAFFAGAAWLAYLSILRLTRSRWVAATATLLAFSSYYALYYGDLIFNDVPALFGLLLTFHGMVLFVEEGRFPQLLAKALGSLFLGWQVYALLLPFTFLGCVRVWIDSRSLRAAVRSRFFGLGLAALLGGVAILAGNLLNERLAIGGRLDDLPTFRHMVGRLGLAPAEVYVPYAHQLAFGPFVKDQLVRIGRMSVPHVLARQGLPSATIPLLGGAALLLALVGGALIRRGALVASLVLSGLCWAIPMRHFVAFHDFQSLFWIGVPLVFFSGLALAAERAGRGPSVGVAAAAFLLFTCSALGVDRIKDASSGPNEVLADFQRIRDVVGAGRRVHVEGDLYAIGGAYHAAEFYLSGCHIQPTPEEADFVVSGRARNPGALTPGNAGVFLYRSEKSAPDLR